MIRLPPRSTQSRSSAASDVYKRQTYDIVEKYENCSYVDYLADSDFSADDFYDGDHLNEQGARKLTKKLYSSLKTLSGDIDSSTNN